MDAEFRAVASHRSKPMCCRRGVLSEPANTPKCFSFIVVCSIGDIQEYGQKHCTKKDRLHSVLFITNGGGEMSHTSTMGTSYLSKH